MKKLVTTGLTGSYFYAWAAFLVIAMMPVRMTAQQGCVMVCPLDPVQISVSDDCQDTIDYIDLDVTLMGCTGETIVDIMDNGVSLGDVVTIGMAGNSYMVIVSNPDGNQQCMATIDVIDGQAPILNCPDDITLECTADLEAYNGLAPGDIQDCSPTQVFIYDSLLSQGNCLGNIIASYRRLYIVVDTFLNADTCIQIISLEKASLDDVVFPPNLTGIDALDCFPLPDTTPVNTGIPSVDDQPILNGAFCNLSVTYNNIVVPLCGGGYKIFRTWRVYDWCDNNIFEDSTQIIEVADFTPPEVTAPADITVSAASVNCFADVILAPALIVEDCSPSWTVRMEGPFGTIPTNGGLIEDLPVGVHQIIFIATNGCSLEGRDTMYVTVQDLQPPVPVCHSLLAIPLDNTGIAIIPADAFDAASQDNCGDVYFKVKRMSLPVGYSCANPGNPTNLFDDFVQFCCEDIANNNIMVILRVYDLPPVPGPVSDAYLAGHYNDCMIEVEVQDKLPPQITCPSNITISCEFPFTAENLNVFGKVVTDISDQEQICIDDPGVPGDPGLQCIGLDGLATDNCSVEVSSTATIDINSCGVGTIVRTFTATDDGDLQATCQQIITVINFDLFDESDIIWPSDYTTTNICEVDLLDPEDLLPPYNEPILNEGACDLVAATHEDMVFDLTNSDEACFKILRTWTVIDWCQLNTNTGGTWTHLQVIKVMNNVAPVIEPVEDINECSFDENCGGLTLDLSAEATDDCSGAASLSWRYSIDFNNDASFEFISPVIVGSSINFSVDFPIGNHRVLYSVWDQCGNTTTESQEVIIESCVPPAAICIHGLSTNLMPVDLDGDGTPDWGMVTILAEMFDASSYHPCGNAFTLSFSEDPLDVSRVFDCNDLGENEVEIWAIDENGLTDFCVTTIDIQDNNNFCPEGQGGMGVISGNLTVPGAGKLAGAMVHLEGSNMAPIPSGTNGYFVFPAMPLGGQYVVRPERNTDVKNGVTTLDLVKIQKHLLGIEAFETPHQYIAADANNSETLSSIDILMLRKLILGHITEFPSNTSWRFIDEAHIFPDPANPWISDWKETYVINPLSGNMDDINFDAVKIGDVNRSANLQATGNIILPRTSKECTVGYKISKDENDLFRVDLTLHDASLYNAVQFSFDWDRTSFEVVEWQPGNEFEEENFRITDQSNEPASVAAYTLTGWQDEEQQLLTLWIRPLSTSNSQFKLYSRLQPTPGVAYTIDGELEAMVVFMKDADSQDAIYNRPNPFRDLTHIIFNSDIEETAELRIYDLSGQVVSTRDIEIVKGENELLIHKSQLKGAGVYLYEIASASQHLTNRMLIVD